MGRWAGRLAFSFIVIAVALAWSGRDAARRGRSPTLRYAGAAFFAAAGAMGLRERHRGGPR
jgi:hypothetical protein